ncbi:putative isoprenylcysteine alpha-carbonyl methylesterase ICME [Hypsizygus marmoreus]|uniref:Isoprenylcysteine alpha-carbonyl methylesterase ICME n=1 Tax=Hypsizygus marmoreus TaxID=39966 RepID=A0A369JKC0_HYPMA|nr:putative isoprenylcysteine alpha-carbonyl methylesterase ICME [Hypsizygus marmoreus]
MDKVAQIASTEIGDIIVPTFSVFAPLLEEKRAEIQEIPRSTFKYRSTDRHQLDVYYPITREDKTQILVWIYGGGFTTGERQMPAPFDLVYANVGAYFARRGFITIIPDYRLAPDTVFPGAAEDVRDAIRWAIKHPEHLTTQNSPNPDTKNIFLMGHSAGAAHAFTALVLPNADDSTPLQSSVAGAILCAGAFDFAPDDPMLDTVKQYWGGFEQAKENDPMGLLASASQSVVASLPRIVLVVGEREPSSLLQVNQDFSQALESRTGKKPAKIVGQGHNHLSVNLTLGTGGGEKWAEEVIAWIRKSE